MKLKTLIKHLTKLSENHPETLNYDVVYSADDEGNFVDVIRFTPTVQCWSKSERMFDSDGKKVVCIN